MEKFFGQVVAFWQGLKRGQRIAIIAIAVIVMIALSFSVFFIGKVEYTTLYANIELVEAGRITEKLDTWKQDYKLVGTTIKVPVNDRDRLRLKLAAEDLAPSGGITGYEIFDVTRLAITDYERRINFLRALQGELRRTIESINGVEEARVLLVLPKRQLFTEEEKAVTASIKLRLSPQTFLSKDQIKGIINLVASAVEGLNPENVTVVDNNGNILSDLLKQEPGLDTVLAAKQLELQRAEAKKIEKMIIEKLSRVLTRDAIEVFVKWEMDFDSQESKLEKYQPFKIKTGEGEDQYPQLKVSDEIIKEEFTGEGKVPGGAPGVESQIPGYKGAATVEGPMKYKKDESRTNYLVDKEETKIVKSPALTKISVAVVVDGTYEFDKDGSVKRDAKTNLPVYRPRNQDELKKYENLVWATIGGRKNIQYPNREYIVTVENVQFDRTAEWMADIARKQEAKKQLIYTGVVVGIIILFLLIGLIALFIHRHKMIEKEALLRQIELQREQALREEVERRAREREEAGEEVMEIGVSAIQIHAIKLAQKNPKLAAEAIRTWMAQG